MPKGVRTGLESLALREAFGVFRPRRWSGRHRRAPADGDDVASDPEPPAPKATPTGVGMPAGMRLDAFGQWLYDAFDETAYLCGSATQGKTWRDVDVRIMLDDDRFDALFPGYASAHQNDAKWALLCAAVSELGRVQTGLPIDFQFQRASDANSKYRGVREPLMMLRSNRGDT